jgi:uncharacterized protein (DUF1800 family)
MKSSLLRQFDSVRGLTVRGLTVSFGRAAVTGSLCGLLAAQPLIAQPLPRPEGDKKPVPVARLTELQGDQRVLHALNRLTFGPRPGDVAAVLKQGLSNWFEQQLNPASIDDSTLDARLAEYPAMKMSLAELEKRYPGPQALKAMIDGKGSLPSDPMTRAMVEDQIAFYKIQRQKAGVDGAAQKAAGQAMADNSMGAGPAASASGDRMDAPATTPKQRGKAKNKQVAAGMAAMDADQPGMAGTMAPDKPIPANEISADAMAAPALAPEDRAAARAEAQKLAALAPTERMQAIMALSPNQLIRMRGAMGQEGSALVAGLTPQQKEMITALPGGVRMIALEAMESRVMRDVYSNRQLEAVMTDFWLNHFNVYVRKNQNEPYLLPAYERETIRPRALGRFEDLLVATAKSPAMLVYLDNFRSVGPDSLQASRLKQMQTMRPNAPQLKQASAGLNENYGRELMELHTLGVNGGYTQADVTMVAKVFTGWGIDRPYQGGDYQFEERRHEPGAKQVLGKTIHENGEREGLEVLHMLATSPATAHFISSKLATRFVSDAPPAALVDRMAASFLKSNGDIKTVLRTMFDSPEFWATDAYRAKVKTPEEFVISAVRASGAQVMNPQALVQSLDKLGMPLYGMQTPNGYSWTKEGWVSTGALVSRMNFSLVLASNRLPGVRLNWAGLLGDSTAAVMPAAYVPTDAASPTTAKEKRLEMLLLGAPVSDRTRATVIGQSGDGTVAEQAAAEFDLNNGGGKPKGKYAPRPMGANAGQNMGPDDPQAAVMAGLLLGSPEFQRR